MVSRISNSCCQFLRALSSTCHTSLQPSALLGCSHPRLNVAIASLETSSSVAQSFGISAQLRGLSYAQPDGSPEWYVKLNNLRDHPNATKPARRVGRGIGGDQGKTCGRGTKGQKSRKGNKPGIMFEGGKGHIWRRFPKVHARPTNLVRYTELNLDRVAQFIKSKRLDPAQVITMKGSESFTHQVHIQVSAATPAARRALERAGGSLTTVYYNQLGLRALLKPESLESQGRSLPKAVRAWPPRMDGQFDAIGQLPPPKQPPLPGLLPSAPAGGDAAVTTMGGH